MATFNGGFNIRFGNAAGTFGIDRAVHLSGVSRRNALGLQLRHELVFGNFAGIVGIDVAHHLGSHHGGNLGYIKTA
ncbi:hypothetical protein CCP3SC1AL1_4090003 [Gammaproteobacteria bacterium]